jgi:hypothetical protein
MNVKIGKHRHNEIAQAQSLGAGLTFEDEKVILAFPNQENYLKWMELLQPKESSLRSKLTEQSNTEQQ